jgi:hypothetical protein
LGDAKVELAVVKNKPKAKGIGEAQASSGQPLTGNGITHRLCEKRPQKMPGKEPLPF